MKRLSASALLLLLFCGHQLAEAQTASITGVVTDASAAVVPQAKVTVRNRTTDASRGTATDGSGNYRITSLVPGIYDVLVERPGFKTVEYSRVELTVGQVQNLSPMLVPSATAETITVEGEEVIVTPVDLDDAQIANMVKSQQVENLPLILRDPYRLILLSPGAIQGNSILHGLSVNGSRERNNNFLLDGTDNNDRGVRLSEHAFARASAATDMCPVSATVVSTRILRRGSCFVPSLGPRSDRAERYSGCEA